MGATFTVRLPCSPAGTPHVEKTPREGKAGAGVRTILGVADEDTVRELLVRVLNRFGYRTLEAASAAEVAGVLHDAQPGPDLLITDMVLPGGRSGRDVAEELRAARPDVAIIFTSGYTQDVTLFTGVLTKNVEFLEKPFMPAQLLAKVEAALNRVGVGGE